MLTLIDLIATAKGKEIITDALAVLASLAEDSEGSIAIVQTQGLKLVVGLMRSCIPRMGKEYCVSILLDLCNNGGEEVVGVLAMEDALMPHLYSVTADGSPQASKKARALIALLQRFREASYSSLAMASLGFRKEG